MSDLSICSKTCADVQHPVGRGPWHTNDARRGRCQSPAKESRVERVRGSSLYPYRQQGLFLLPRLHTDCINHVIYSPVAIHSFATDLLTGGGEVVNRLKSFLIAAPCEDPDRRRIEIHSSKISVDGINAAHDRRTPSYHRHIPLGCRRQRIEQHECDILCGCSPDLIGLPRVSSFVLPTSLFLPNAACHRHLRSNPAMGWASRPVVATKNKAAFPGWFHGLQRERNTRVKEKPPRRSSGREGPRETVSSSALHHSARAREVLVKGTTEVNGRWVKGDIGLRAETSERQRSKSFCTSGGRTG